MKIYHFPSKEAFFRNMDQILQTGDTILVKASHGMEFPEILKLATAISAATAESDLTVGYDLNRAMELKDQVQLEKME